MKNGKKADLSAIDPVATEPGWHRSLETIAERAFEMRTRNVTVSSQIFRWAAPLAAAVMVVMLVGGSLLIAFPQRESAQTGTSGSEPGYQLMVWSASGELPPTQTIIATLGGGE